MNIILCDDERNFAEALREEIKNFFDNKSMQVNITWYGSWLLYTSTLKGQRELRCRKAILWINTAIFWEPTRE